MNDILPTTRTKLKSKCENENYLTICTDWFFLQSLSTGGKGMRLLAVIILSLVTTACMGARPTPEQLANEKFAECPTDYQENIKNQIGARLIDPYSAMYRFSKPEKYVYQGEFGHFVVVGVNAKNRFGGYVGEDLMHFMCFKDGIRQINELATGFASGLRR